MTTAYVKIVRQHYTPRELARMLGCSRQRVVAMIERGELEAVKTPGGHYRIPASVVEGADREIRLELAHADVDA